MRKQESFQEQSGLENANTLLDANVLNSIDSFYPYILDICQEGIWILDAGGRILYANTQMAELLGTNTANLKEQNFYDFIFKEDKQVASLFLGSWTESRKKPFEIRYCQTSGEERWVNMTATQVKDSEGNNLGILAMNADITERKKTETALNKSLENMGIIINSVKDYAIMTTDPDRRILSWNKGAQLVFGYTEEEILGQVTDVLFIPEDRENRVPELELETALKVGHSFDDRWHIRKDGSTFFASGVLTRLNQYGEGPKFIKIARDFTERKKLEELLKKADQHKNEFLATLSHELRNPLASILSGMEVLKQEQNVSNRLKTQEIMERQIQQTIHLVNDLLDISRISLGKIKITKKPVNLIDAVHLALETSRPIITGYKHDLSVSLPEGLVMVDGDMTRLSQVFLNILVNSAKYTPPSGRISLTMYRSNNHVITKITDNGIGIPKEMLATIFEMFEQIQNRNEYPQAGLGIGLSVVKQLVEMHGGEVTASSEGPDKGSVFTISLPVLTEEKITPLPKDKEQDNGNNVPAKIAAGKKILVIDDNTDAADMMEILLRKKGYSIRKAYNGKTGISTALDFNPEIVLLDLGLPDMNGYEVLKELQQKLNNCFYLALSGWGQEEDLKRSREAGFHHHLVKPIDIKSLDEILMLNSDMPGQK